MLPQGQLRLLPLSWVPVLVAAAAWRLTTKLAGFRATRPAKQQATQNIHNSGLVTRICLACPVHLSKPTTDGWSICCHQQQACNTHRNAQVPAALSIIHSHCMPLLVVHSCHHLTCCGATSAGHACPVRLPISRSNRSTCNTDSPCTIPRKSTFQSQLMSCRTGLPLLLVAAAYADSKASSTTSLFVLELLGFAPQESDVRCRLAGGCGCWCCCGCCAGIGCSMLLTLSVIRDSRVAKPGLEPADTTTGSLRHSTPQQDITLQKG